MLNTAGLSLDQAPPIRVPFAFFLAAPLFLMLGAGLLLWRGDLALVTRWSPTTLALTHLIVLGFLTQVMCGALLQMLPVLAGSPVPGVALVGPVVQLMLVLGTLSLSLGLDSGRPLWLVAGGVLLALGLIGFMLAAGVALGRARGVPQSVRAMSLALVALLMTLVLGGMLITALLGIGIPGLTQWVNLHLGWGLLGWVGLLVMGVGYQVVPMFYVTPAYPRWLTRMGAPLVLAGLMVATVLIGARQASAALWGFALAVGGLCLFALVTLDRQRRRERRRVDATLLYWWTAMLAALVAAGIWALGGRADLVGVCLLIGVGVGLPSGMLMKIMPFLSWFHLQHRQVAARRFDVRLPTMQVFLPEEWARIQFVFFVAALLCLALVASWPGAVWGGWLARVGGLALMASAALLWWLQIRCYLRYRELSRRLA